MPGNVSLSPRFPPQMWKRAALCASAVIVGITGAAVAARSEQVGWVQLNYMLDPRCPANVPGDYSYAVQATDDTKPSFMLNSARADHGEGLSAWMSPFEAPVSDLGIRVYQWMMPYALYNCFAETSTNRIVWGPNTAKTYSGWGALIEDRTIQSVAEEGGSSGGPTGGGGEGGGGTSNELWCNYTIRYNPYTGEISSITTNYCWYQ